jgi:hypothetical protein
VLAARCSLLAVLLLLLLLLIPFEQTKGTRLPALGLLPLEFC